jgi:hypothetical protein
MTKQEYSEMNLLVPLCLAYRRTGVSSDCDIDLSSILWEFAEATTTENRRIQVQKLTSLTRKLLEDYESEILLRSSWINKQLGSTEVKRDKSLLLKKLEQYQSALVLTARWHAKHDMPRDGSEAAEDPASSVGSVNVSATCPDDTRESVEADSLSRIKRLSIQRKGSKGYVPETGQECMQVKETAIIRTQADDLADEKRKL